MLRALFKKPAHLKSRNMCWWTRYFPSWNALSRLLSSELSHPRNQPALLPYLTLATHTARTARQDISPVCSCLQRLKVYSIPSTDVAPKMPRFVLFFCRRDSRCRMVCRPQPDLGRTDFVLISQISSIFARCWFVWLVFNHLNTSSRNKLPPQADRMKHPRRFWKRKINELQWIKGTENISDYLTKRNIVMHQKLNQILIRGCINNEILNSAKRITSA